MTSIVRSLNPPKHKQTRKEKHGFILTYRLPNKPSTPSHPLMNSAIGRRPQNLHPLSRTAANLPCRDRPSETGMHQMWRCQLRDVTKPLRHATLHQPQQLSATLFSVACLSFPEPARLRHQCVQPCAGDCNYAALRLPGAGAPSQRPPKSTSRLSPNALQPPIDL